MKLYAVVSPERMTYGGCYEPPEAPEYGCDVEMVWAASKRDALMLGVQSLLKDHRSMASDNRSDGLPPWAGYRVEECPEEPMPVSDALADAETLRLNVADEDVTRAGRLAAVALHPNVGLSSLTLYARGCARAAFRAVPELRG